MTHIVVIMVALCCGAASAQPVFFDDFDGPDLLPHWSLNPARWEYNVSDGRLNVTDLLFPSVPKLEANFAIIGAQYAPQTDFRMDVWMGWENPTEPWNELWFAVMGPQGQGIVDFGMRHRVGEPPEVSAAVTTGVVIAPAPEPGTHHFTIARIGSQFDLYLNGDHFGSLPDRFGTKAAGLSVFFSKPFPGEMNPYHIERVLVVPASGTLASMMIPAAFHARRARVCNQTGGAA